MEFFPAHAQVRLFLLLRSTVRSTYKVVLLLSGFMRLSPRYRCRAGKQTRVGLRELQ